MAQILNIRDIRLGQIAYLLVTHAHFDHASHAAYRPDRIFFVCAANGMPCATASAYQKKDFNKDAGYLHYVGVSPSHAGRRLGFTVSLAVLHKFRKEGFHSAVIETDDFRLPAIKTYLRLGFAPLMRHKTHPARWDAVFARLGIPSLRDAIKGG